MKRVFLTGITLICGTILGTMNMILSSYAFYQSFQAIHGCNANSFFQMNSPYTLMTHVAVFLGAIFSFVLGFIAATKPWSLFLHRAYDYAFHVSTSRALTGFVTNPVIIGYVLFLLH